MIVVKLISGLGNQLFQYAIGKQLSITNNTTLKLDISFYKDQNLRSYKLNNYNISSDIAKDEEINKFLKHYNNKTLYSKVYRKIESYFPKQHRKRFKEDEPWIFEPKIFSKFDDIYIDGYWQNYKYFENLDPKVFNDFSLKNNSSNKLKDLVAKIRYTKPSVSVHVRRGDYISDSEANKLMGVLSLEYYYKAIQCIKEKTNNPTFYFFSDDLNWVKKNIKLDSPVYYIEGNEDYVDLELMRTCDHNIIANSSFSWWGAYLNQNPDRIVIAPEQWVIPKEINNNIQIQFPSWIKI